MDQRTIDFIRCLRAAGVRISLAESQDALRAVEAMGIHERGIFSATLHTTLIKDNRDTDAFDYFFPRFFDQNEPPMIDMQQELSPEQQEQLQQALQSLMGDENALRQLLEQLLQGQHFSDDQLQNMAQQSGMQNADNINQEGWFARRLQRQAGLDQLRDLIEQLMEELREMGMSDDARQEIREMLAANAEALAEQLENFAGMSIAENMADQEPQPPQDVDDLDFQHLTRDEADAVRDEIRRLAARLRSRASLRQKRAKEGTLDPKRIIRHNLRYGGTPIELKHRKRHKKPKLVVICDLSGSMRYMSEFALTLTYMLHDVIAKTRSFIFIDNMVEVTHHFQAQRPEIAVETVLRENPRGYYSTDLGHSLRTFDEKFLDAVDSRTNILVVGDGRNNYNDPRVDLAEHLQRRARRLLWFCPEPEFQWGTGDSDLHLYAPKSDGVYLVRNLRELGQAVDEILADG
ncbi:MAG: VWA domain-containing protein [Anaerolineales bacterium]